MTSDSIQPGFAPRDSHALEVHLLGLVDFDAALFLQERLAYEIGGRDDTQGRLLICEHPPLITVGREGSRGHIRLEPRDLLTRQIDVRWLNRGGGCVAHAPGQLAVYPIVPLDRLETGLAEYRTRLEQALLDVCRELQVAAHRDGSAPGIWGRGGRIAQIGVAVKSWVSYHGLFLNVSPPREFLQMVDGNGADPRITSLAAERQAVTSMHKVREAVVRRLAANLGYEKQHVYTGHPLLRRTQRRVYVSA